MLTEAGLNPECARHTAEDAIVKIPGAVMLSRGLDAHSPLARVIKCLLEELLRSKR